MERRDEFEALFRRFAAEWLTTPKGRELIAWHDAARREVAQSYAEICAAKDRGEDVTERVLLRLLPHANTTINRERGAWLHPVGVYLSDVRAKFRRHPEKRDWTCVADAVLAFLRKCVDDPEELVGASTQFLAQTCTSGIHSGTLGPVLNSLRPDRFLIVNAKSLRLINEFTGNQYGSHLAEYPAANAAGWRLIEEVRDFVQEVAGEVGSVPDLIDAFGHWLKSVVKIDVRPRDGRRGGGPAKPWRIDVGTDPANWVSWRESNYIALPWPDVGDVSTLSYTDYKTRFKRLYTDDPSAAGAGIDQIWRFAREMQEGVPVVVTAGPNTIVAVATVRGPYEYVQGAEFAHRRSVEWADLEERRFNAPGHWRMRLLRVDERTWIEATGQLPSPAPHEPRPFGPRTFELLAELSKAPTADTYHAHKDEIVRWVERPLRELLRDVAALLPEDIRRRLETERGVMAKILKNDYGRRGAKDCLWGAFYHKGGQRLANAQLGIWINKDGLSWGFYIGENGRDVRGRIARAVTEHGHILPALLALGSHHLPLRFNDHGNSSDSSGLGPAFANRWEQWIANVNRGVIGAGIDIPAAKVLTEDPEALQKHIAETFVALYPLVLLAESTDPLRDIRKYRGIDIGDGHEPHPPMPLEEVAERAFMDVETLSSWVRAIERKGQAVLYGPPGTGKTFLAQLLAEHLAGRGDGIVELVQFHPAYAYEDFVEGMRPRANDDGRLDYPTVPGRLLDFCARARDRAGRSVLIIDEINRADLSRVFGELMYLLEYRDRAIPLASGTTFSFPLNVRLIGTMNTADRSIALVDHALRRRFAFLRLEPNYDGLRRFHERNGSRWSPERLIDVLRDLNRAIGDSHYEIGTSYFLRHDVADQIEDIWRMEIEPFLDEFFFDKQDVVRQFAWRSIGPRIQAA